MNTGTRLALATLAAGLVLGAAPGARAACSLSVPPIKNDVCQQDTEWVPGYGNLSCASPRNHDQTTYCGAVYGYEQHWCYRIRNGVLRDKCLRDSE